MISTSDDPIAEVLPVVRENAPIRLVQHEKQLFRHLARNPQCVWATIVTSLGGVGFSAAFWVSRYSVFSRLIAQTCIVLVVGIVLAIVWAMSVPGGDRSG